MNRRWRSGEDKKCLVCLQDIHNGLTKVGNMPCGHLVHLKCLKFWYDKGKNNVELEPGWSVRLGKTCPYCRKVYRVYSVIAVQIED